MRTDPVGTSAVTQLQAQLQVQAQTQAVTPENQMMAPDTLSAYVGSAFTDTAVYTGSKVENNKVLIDLNMVSNFLGLPGPKHEPKSDYRVNAISKDDEQRQKDEDEEDENKEQQEKDSDDSDDRNEKKDHTAETAAQAVELAEQQKLADSVKAQSAVEPEIEAQEDDAEAVAPAAVTQPDANLTTP